MGSYRRTGSKKLLGDNQSLDTRQLSPAVVAWHVETDKATGRQTP
jgi:hypothetical protein